MLALAMLLGYGGYRIGHGEMTIGVLIAFFQYGLRFFRPIQDLSEKYNILQGAMAASERIFKLLDTRPEIVNPPAPDSRPGEPAGIEFDRVWFAYKGEDWVLRDVSFRIETGETIAVVGHTGAGKTTLTNLLLRFYDIQRGAIRLGGIDIRELRPCGPAQPVRNRAAGSVSVHRDGGGQYPAGNLRALPMRNLWTALERVNLRDFVRLFRTGSHRRSGNEEPGFPRARSS